MSSLKLFMVLAGCYPATRHTEQHDVFFGIGYSMKDLIPQLRDFWPEGLRLHIDSWREVTVVDDYAISVVEKTEPEKTINSSRLFFLNLGGYKPGESEEYHYKMLVVANDKTRAIECAKKTAFFKHTGFKGAESHIDDKYGVDIDDVYQVEEILHPSLKEKYQIIILPVTDFPADDAHIGYFKLSSFI